MPNLLTHNTCCSAVDLVSEQFDFESASALIDYLLAYTPRGPVEDAFYQLLLDEQLGIAEGDQATGIADIPF